MRSGPIAVFFRCRKQFHTCLSDIRGASKLLSTRAGTGFVYASSVHKSAKYSFSSSSDLVSNVTLAEMLRRWCKPSKQQLFCGPRKSSLGALAAASRSKVRILSLTEEFEFFQPSYTEVLQSGFLSDTRCDCHHHFDASQTSDVMIDKMA